MCGETNDTRFENMKAIQFNGWNFGAIYDWVQGKQGLYTADFKNEIKLNGEIVHRNDWIVKEEDGTFNVMSNFDFQERMDKMK
jgi:hypothetical protein